MSSEMTWKERGNAHFKEGDLASAINCYTEGIKMQKSPVMSKNDDAAALWCNRAVVHAKMNDWGASLRDSECAILCREKFAKAFFRLGFAHLRLGQGDAACRVLKRGLGMTSPKSREASDLRGALVEAEAIVAEHQEETIAAAACNNSCAVADKVLVSVGFRSSHVKADMLPMYGRGLVAQRSLLKGEVIATVDRSHAMSIRGLSAHSEAAKRMAKFQTTSETRVTPKTEFAVLLLEVLIPGRS